MCSCVTHSFDSKSKRRTHSGVYWQAKGSRGRRYRSRYRRGAFHSSKFTRWLDASSLAGEFQSSTVVERLDDLAENQLHSFQSGKSRVGKVGQGLSVVKL